MTTYQIIVFVWMFAAIITMFVLMKVTAPFGRHSISTWGPMISNKLAWIIMEIPGLLIFSIFLFTTDNKLSFSSWFAYGIYAFHYINRSFIFPFRIKTKGKKMPVVIMASAIFFNIMNGTILGYYFSSPESEDNYLTPYFVLGAVLFLIGVLVNFKSDNILIRLRKPNETDYKIPYGGLFEYVSCPNLFGEILEWLGYAVMFPSLSTASFFVWSFANLFPRALKHHEWYKNKFSNYPKERKAIFPFIK